MNYRLLHLETWSMRPHPNNQNPRYLRLKCSQSIRKERCGRGKPRTQGNRCLLHRGSTMKKFTVTRAQSIYSLAPSIFATLPVVDLAEDLKAKYQFRHS